MRMVRPLVLIAAALAAAPGQAADGSGDLPRTMVVGTGNPEVDVAAVQAAVDRGGQILLQGHFSFSQPPTKSTRPTSFLPRLATVLVTKESVISGVRNSQGEMTTIEGGTWPFAVEAQGGPVTLQFLRFVRPRGGAIQVNAVDGLLIKDCRVEGVEPIRQSDLPGAKIGFAIAIATVPAPPTPTKPGQPENISGVLSIVNNFLDAAGGTVDDMTVGILVFSAGGLTEKSVDLYISGNRISNVTERAINIRQLGGQAHIEHNIINTGSIAGAASGVAPDAIHAFGAGAYLIAHNSIQSDWATGAGIRVHASYSESPINGAIVMDNDLNMIAPENAVFGASSAAIEIRGYAQANVVLNNRVRGRARTGLALVNQGQGIPGNNQFVANDLNSFQPSLAGVFVDAGVTNTLLIGQKSDVQDGGIGTVIVGLGGKEK
jgi:hypothetical protein